ncbi:MAG: glycosyltransferase [Vulcanimicrobiota bacterium]
MKIQPLKVMVVHSSATGAGHRVAAESLVDALKEHPGVTAESFDTLTVSSPQVREAQQSAIKSMERIPGLSRWAYEAAVRGNPIVGLAQLALMAVKAHKSPEALQHIQDFQPDLIVSTQAEASQMLAHWKRGGKVEAPVWSVLTDHVADGRWVSSQVDRYFVANQPMVDEMTRLGVDAHKVEVSGIPIRPPVISSESNAELRQRLGLQPDLATVVITGGGLGGQPFELLVEEMGKLPFPKQIVCITGTNQQARQALEEQSCPHPLLVQGKVDNMQEWMRAADVVVTKAGGLSTSEIQALGKPMVIHRPVSGLAVRNSERLVEIGSALIGRDVADTAAQTEVLLSHPQPARGGRPGAAAAVAQSIVQFLNT